MFSDEVCFLILISALVSICFILANERCKRSAICLKVIEPLWLIETKEQLFSFGKSIQCLQSLCGQLIFNSTHLREHASNPSPLISLGAPVQLNQIYFLSLYHQKLNRALIPFLFLSVF